MFYYKLKIVWKTFFCRNHVPLTLKKNDVLKTGDVVKQTYFVRNLHGENFKLFKKTYFMKFYQNFRQIFHYDFFGEKYRSANIADPVQTPQSAASELGLQCLHTSTKGSFQSKVS